MTHIIALFNQAGGVGKSTMTMNLGYHLAKRGHRVLLVDMDPQGTLTDFMGLESAELENTVYNAIVEEEELPIHKDINDMDIAPANLVLSGAELSLVVADMRDFRLSNALKPVIENYDFTLIDCPPSLGILSYISLVAATHVLIPIETENKALKGTELLFNTLARVKKGVNPKAKRNHGPNPHLKVAGLIPTMHDARTAQHKRSLQSIQQLGGQLPILPTIPRAIAFADASEKDLPLALYNSSHPAIKTLEEITDHLEKL